ncbi:MAG: helix-turn-helix transcriptional regulator [Ruminococcus sp.]|nr:helix-turn-helix transcriptional regulator [Ruminococcus sp.]
MEQKEFSLRLSMLRINKGVSARDMSLSLGQSPGYINNIEVGKNFPSMTVFFYICEYLGITPAEFFQTDSQNPQKERELMEAAKGLNNQQLDNLIFMAKGLKK